MLRVFRRVYACVIVSRRTLRTRVATLSRDAGKPGCIGGCNSWTYVPHRATVADAKNPNTDIMHFEAL